MLVGIRGSYALNYMLTTMALKFTPALFIDSANCSDIHRFNHFPMENYIGLHIVPAESLYRFLPTIKSIPELVERTNSRAVFITTFTHLFDYDDEVEVNDVFNNAWELLRNLGKEYNIFVGIEKGSIHESISKCKIMDADKMGHTINSQRIETDMLLNELKQFGKALKKEDKEIFDELIKHPLKHLGSISYASSVNVWVFFLLSVLIEQEKKNVALRRVQEEGKDSIMAED